MRDKKLHLTRSQCFERAEDGSSNPGLNPTIGDVIGQRFARRDILKGALGVTAIAATTGALALQFSTRAAAKTASRFPFEELAAGVDITHHVAVGHDADVLIRWGDGVLPGAPAFDPFNQSAAAQRLQFGYNNDFLGYFPMPGAQNPSAHGLLVVNHEYTNEELMFPGLGRQDLKGVAFAGMTPELVAIEMAAHGGSVLEVRRDNGKMDRRPQFKICPAHRCDNPDADQRPGRWRCADANQRRSSRQIRPRHDQQLRRWRHAVGNLVDLRGEFQLLF